MIITKTFAVGQRCIELRVYVPMTKLSELPELNSTAVAELSVGAENVMRESQITLGSNRAGLHYAAFIPNTEATESRLIKSGWRRSKGN